MQFNTSYYVTKFTVPLQHEGESPPIMEDRYKGIKKMAQNKKTTGTKAASSASKTLTSKSTGAKSKALSGSALSQTGAPKRQTSSKAASAARRQDL